MKEFWTVNRRIYPSIFRVLIGFVLLIDLIFTLPAGSFLWDSNLNASLPQSEFYQLIIPHWQIFAGFYGLVLLLFMGGIGKNFLAFLVFLFHWIWVDLTMPLLTWGDTILKFSLLYFTFVNSFYYLSVKMVRTESFLSQLGIWSMILHLFLVYLNNAYFKIMDIDWQEGRALFYSFSQYPSFETSVLKPIISNAFLTKYLGYLVILQQLTFVPLVIWRKTRYGAILISILIHLTMMFQFGLWKFELIVILLYGFLLSDDEWKRLIPTKIQSKFFSN
jgi:hypothetical protein